MSITSNVWHRLATWGDLETARRGLQNAIDLATADRAVILAGQQLRALRGLLMGAVKTSNYTLALNDDQDVVRMSSASALVCTIPTNAAVALPVGYSFPIARWGTGTVQIAVTGLTIRCARSAPYMIAAQYGEPVLCTKVATDEWWLTGGLS